MQNDKATPLLLLEYEEDVDESERRSTDGIRISMVSSLNSVDIYDSNVLIQDSPISIIKSDRYYCYMFTYFTKCFLFYLLIAIIQIGTASLQYVLLYTNHISMCTVNNINANAYHIESLSLFCMTLLPFIFILLLRESTEETVDFKAYISILIINWCVLFGLSIHGYIVWKYHISCVNNTWYRIIKILFIIWFIEQSIVTLRILYHYFALKRYIRKFGLYLSITCIQLIACIMQMILIFHNDCIVFRKENINHIIAYRFESIFIFIVYIAALIAMIRKMKQKTKFTIMNLLWFLLFGLSVHSYTVWYDDISCSNNKYRIIMILLFFIWFSEQLLVMVGAASYWVRDMIKDHPQVIIIACGVLFLFCCLVALPIIASLLQVFYLANSSCKGINVAISISLLGITILIFLLLICLLFFIKDDIRNLKRITRSAYIINYVAVSMCILLLWFTQFGLAYTSLKHLKDVTCIAKRQEHALQGLYLSWIVIYSTVCSVIIIGGFILVGFKIIGIKRITAVVLILFQLGVYVAATLLQLILIVSGDCKGDIVSGIKTAFLIILMILQCCLLGVLKISKTIVICCECILFLVIYSFVIKSMKTWGSNDVHCSDKETLKTLAFILFLVWMIQYTLYIVAGVIGGYMAWCRKG